MSLMPSRATSCAPSAPRRSQASASSRKTPPKQLATPARREQDQFGPAWLDRQLRRLLPEYPAVCLCVAFSGGLDSTALLGACAQLKGAAGSVRAIHINHQLQAASASWGAHCRRVARALGVPVTVRTVTVARTRGTSLEAAAREARYAALGSLLRAGEV